MGSRTHVLSCHHIPVRLWLSLLGTGSGGLSPEVASAGQEEKGEAVCVQPSCSDTTAQQPEGTLSIPETANSPQILGQTPFLHYQPGISGEKGVPLPLDLGRTHSIPKKRTKNMPAGS